MSYMRLIQRVDFRSPSVHIQCDLPFLSVAIAMLYCHFLSPVCTLKQYIWFAPQFQGKPKFCKFCLSCPLSCLVALVPVCWMLRRLHFMFTPPKCISTVAQKCVYRGDLPQKSLLNGWTSETFIIYPWILGKIREILGKWSSFIHSKPRSHGEPWHSSTAAEIKIFMALELSRITEAKAPLGSNRFASSGWRPNWAARSTWGFVEGKTGQNYGVSSTMLTMLYSYIMDAIGIEMDSNGFEID